MDTETMIRELESVEEKHKHDKVFTGQINIATMAHDVRKRLEELKPYEDTDLTPGAIQKLKERDESKPPIYQVQGDERYEQEPEWWMCPCCDEVYDMDDDYDFCPKCGQRLLR
nr:hypothetical protein [uncultured Merdimonas sp.]